MHRGRGALTHQAALTLLMVLLPTAVLAGDPSFSGVDGLTVALQEPDAAVRLLALEWLARRSEEKASGVDSRIARAAGLPGMREAIEGILATGEDSQQALLRALTRLPPLAELVEVQVLQLAENGTATVRPHAIHLLGRLEALAEPTRAALLQLLITPEESARIAAQDAVRNRLAADLLLASEVDKWLADPKRRRWVLPVVASSEYDPDRLRVIYDALQDPDRESVRFALQYLRKHGVPVLEAASLASDLGRMKLGGDLAACSLAPHVTPSPDSVEFVRQCLAGGPRQRQDALAALEHVPASSFIQFGISAQLYRLDDSQQMRQATLPVVLRLAPSDRQAAVVAALRDDGHGLCDLALDAVEPAEVDLAVVLPGLLEAIGNTACDAAKLGRAIGEFARLDKSVPGQLAGRIRGETAARHRTIKAIAASSTLRERFSPLLPALLRDGDAAVREAAFDLSLSVPLSDAGIAELVVPDAPVEVIHALGQAGPRAAAYAPLLIEELRSPDDNRVAGAVAALGQMGALETKGVDLDALFAGKWRVKKALILALAGSPALVAKFSARLGDTMQQDPTLAADVIRALTGAPEVARERALDFLPYLQASTPEERSDAAMKALIASGPHSDEFLAQLLERSYTDSAAAPRYRFFAYLCATGEHALRNVWWLGRVEREASEVSELERRRALKGFNAVWQATEQAPSLRAGLGDVSAEIVSTMHLGEDDLDGVDALVENLRAANLPATDRIARALLWARIRIFAGYSALLLGLHLCLWLVLLAVYPYSTALQAAFAWNPVVRKLIGLYYADSFTVHLRALRERLFAPSRHRLIEDATLAEGTHTDEHYFADSKVEYDELAQDGRTTRARRRVVDALPEVRGVVVLEGDSGLGKSMYLRRLARGAKRLTAYLPAHQCTRGVLPALQDKLQGIAAEEGFLRSVIYVGGLDLIIDGLNEVAPDTRASITQFVRANPRLNVVLATQALLDWRPPGRVHHLQPLADAQIEAFLRSRASATAPAPTGAAGDYTDRCGVYVREALDSTQPAELLAAVRMVLSNPMDLTIVADMLAAGERPNLLRLQEQQYRLAAQRFRRANGREFPLQSFSERIFRLRLEGDATLPVAEFPAEVDAVAAQKMAFSRETSGAARRWFFRHDKIAEFFLLQTFLGDDNERPKQYLEDPRFRGVYFLMATQLPLAAARALRDELVVLAAMRSNHSVSDRFVQLLESRKALRETRPAWEVAYELPPETRARARIAELVAASDELTAQMACAREQEASARRQRSMLHERTDDRLGQRVAEVLAALGATGPGEVNDLAFEIKDDSGRPLLVSALASTESITAQDVEDALRAISAMPKADHLAKLLFIINAHPDLDPRLRTEWLTADAVAAIERCEGVSITTLTLWRALERSADDARIPRRLWDTLAAETGHVVSIPVVIP